ncbi:DMT family transporter [Frigidibacter sp. RF13]|uniref:DMT family transporter n=1 Tax=Frigidibacter sp. RF13 TaxID=2997340 RepID=UPI00226EB556|nr:DMT family transporter [Frigidibacter sp. RF13]MCY1126347.1 DMT family transporter [Frigidibacter sp. RF13]
MLWVPVTIVAALAQTGRNAAQAGLTKRIGTVGATQVRFLFGLPFALVFLLIVRLATGEPLPAPGARALGFTAIGALAQIGATALMLKVMQARSFALATAWIKTEPVLLALGAALILGDPLGPGMLLAIVIATAGVIISSTKPGVAFWGEVTPVLTGIAAAGLFGLSAIGYRGGIVTLGDGSFLIRATSTLVIALTLQTAVLILWMALADRQALVASFRVWRASLGAGFLGAFASEFWFLGFALTAAANVRTLALIEVIFAQAVSIYWFRQKVSRRQWFGMAIIVLGVALLLRAEART